MLKSTLWLKGQCCENVFTYWKFKGQISRLSRAAEIRTSCSLNTTHLFPRVKEDCTLLKIKNTFPHVAHVLETVNVFCLSGLKNICTVFVSQKFKLIRASRALPKYLLKKFVFKKRGHLYFVNEELQY